jgi:hypothetical protein
MVVRLACYRNEVGCLAGAVVVQEHFQVWSSAKQVLQMTMNCHSIRIGVIELPPNLASTPFDDLDFAID